MLRAWQKGHRSFVHAAPVERMLTKIDDHYESVAFETTRRSGDLRADPGTKLASMARSEGV
jgi:hypothetical protein